MGSARTQDRVRVVVTGLGMVSAAGTGVEAAWEMLLRGESALAPIESFEAAAYGKQLGGEARHLDRVPDLDRSFQLLDLALDEVLDDAGWSDEQQGPGTGVVLGTSQGSIDKAQSIHRQTLRRPQELPTAEDCQVFENYRPGAGTDRVAHRAGATGPSSTIGMVCVSSAVALIHAADLLRRGVCDRVIAGGFEEFSQFVFTGFHCIGALAQGPLRPFDEERDGTALGEAAVLVTLETLDSARARGARIYAELRGGGYAADAVHMTAPDREGRGLERAIRQAFVEASLGPAEVDYLCAHGTGTVFNDAMECEAFGRIFSELRELGRMPPLSGMKSVFGHTLGAAGVLDAVMTILCLSRGVLPPTVALKNPIEDWNFVPGQGSPPDGRLQIGLSTNSAFGGNNSALLFERWSSEGEGL
ncbi:MAG: beta-ketoacyl-[acyl-carrier-protein] synthase family protein [Myxococcota bacterium]|nr:beta-ketoacyl-[acyl-carrier-protein] synthase family protein [Myxococcota bacterium]